MRECILTYSEIDREEWSRLVATSATGTWFQTPEAYCFYKSLPDRFRPFVVAVERVRELENERVSELKGICVGYVTIEKCAIKQMMTRRAIILGGPALADDACSEEVELLMKAVREQLQVSDFRFQVLDAPIYVETRNFNDYSRWKEAFERAGFSYKPHLNFHVDCTDKEKMWERLSENRKRQMRHARGAGVTIADLRLEIGNCKLQVDDCRLQVADSTEFEIREWYEILERLYKTKVKTPLWPVEFFLEAYRQGIGKYLMVKYNGKVIGGLMMVEWRKGGKELENERIRELENVGIKELMNEGINELKSERINELTNEGTVYEWFECGLNAEYKEQYPAVMATWAGMEYAAEHDIPRCDFMGAGEPGVPYGVRDFKEKFGGELVEHGRFLYIAKPMLYQIGKLGVKILKRIR